MTWKSEILSGPDPMEAPFPDSDFDPAEYEEWLERVMREPWVHALVGLVRWSGLWVGAEEALMLELKARAGREAAASEDFPSSLERLDRYMSIAEDGFHERDIGLLDYQELSEEDRDDFDVPGWGPDAPVLVCQGDAPYRPNFWVALRELLKYWHPVPVAVLTLTASREFAKERRRSYTTENFARALRKHLLVMFNVPMVFLDMTRPEGFKGIDPVMGEEREHMMDPRGLDGHRVFHAQMRKWAPILREWGIVITREKRPVPPGITMGGDEERPAKTWWTVEAPRWKKPDLKFWAE